MCTAAGTIVRTHRTPPARPAATQTLNFMVVSPGSQASFDTIQVPYQFSDALSTRKNPFLK